MTELVLLAAPLVLASLVLLVAFVGCHFEPGTLPTALYSHEVFNHPNLVGYWRLDEAPGATHATDTAPNGGNLGKYEGGVALGEPGLDVTEPTNTAARFEPLQGAYVKVPYRAALNPPEFTVVALVGLVGGAGTYRAVVSSRNLDPPPIQYTFGYILYASADNKWEAWVGDGQTSWVKVQGPEAVDGPYFLAMTYDGTTLKLYVNPAVEPPATVAVNYQENTVTELRIGAGANEAATPLYFFPGRIDEVQVYNTALDLATIQRHYKLARGL
jgi:Concanavalin A-like lectin/glucanases superfamily